VLDGVFEAAPDTDGEVRLREAVEMSAQAAAALRRQTPFALEPLHATGTERQVYPVPKPGPDGHYPNRRESHM
jgi:hypothetical protein